MNIFPIYKVAVYTCLTTDAVQRNKIISAKTVYMYNACLVSKFSSSLPQGNKHAHMFKYNLFDVNYKRCVPVRLYK